ncbi:class F sortase [Streptomyces sp. 4N509B]|uniref:class F sortase n=1 Tax=Streptomyces sp. 4N509B TaxID=3457413 RepID=UPI003FD2050B
MGGRLVSWVTWTVLLLGLWAWGVHLTSGQPPGGADDVRGAGVGAGVGGGEVTGEGATAALAKPLAGDAAPERLTIPAIGVRAEVMARGIDANGGVEPPPFDAPQAVGWYADGPTPGASGAAVLVGHVDTATEPAVFYDLGSLEPGDTVHVTRSDGSEATFAVDEVELIDHADFDATYVYGPREQGAAELRLITCGGDYDQARDAYSANVVVSAHLTGAVGSGGVGG